MNTPRHLFLFFLVCLSLPVQGQVNSDSLWAIWQDKSHPLETRMKAIESIDRDDRGMSRRNNPDSAFHRAELIYDEALANESPFWMGRSLLEKGNYHLNKGTFEVAAQYYNQAKEIGEKNNIKELIGGSYFNIGLIHLKKGEADYAINNFSKAIEYYKELDKPYILSAAMDFTAMVYRFMKSDPREALKYLEASLEIKEELIKIDETPRDRFVLNGIKNTIKTIKDGLEETKDTIDLNTYNSEEEIKEAPSKNPKSTPAKVPSPETKEESQEEAYQYLLQSLQLNKKNGDLHLIAEDLHKLAMFNDVNSNLDSASHYYSQSLEIHEKLGDKSSIAFTLGHFGRILIHQGQIGEALEKLDRGRQIYQEMGNQNEMAHLQNTIAYAYKTQKDLDKALNLFQENLKYYQDSGNKMSEAGSRSNIGNIYRNLGDTALATHYYEEALQIFEDIGYQQGIAGVNLEIGSINFKRGLLDVALKNKTKALTLSEKIGYEEGILLAQGGIASVYAAQNKHNKAISFGRRALALSEHSGNLSQIMQGSLTLSKSYKALGRYREAFEMYELYYQSRDSLQNLENQKAVIQQQFQSDYDKQKALDDLENEKRVAIETQKKEDQQVLSVVIGIGLLLISILALFIFNRLRITRQQKIIIEEQKKKVEQSEKYKEQFLANMSHEIRTPMHAISGMVKILQRNEHLPSQDIYLNAMQSSSENLVVILNDVLDLSKIEAGKLDIESIPISPAQVMENVVQILKYKAEEKGLMLNHHIEDGTPELVMGDPSRLNQILINIVGNAIKFTEKGELNIHLKTKNDRLLFSVQDSGIGIPKDKINSIFDAFEQAKNTTHRHYSGTGLGLSISKQLVELQEGKIWAESKEGIGSTFFIDLPLLIATSNQKGETAFTTERLQAMSSSLKGIRILLAEDNPFNQMIAQDDLSYLLEDVQIETVENGVQALDKFKSGNFDLILMDVQMPIMNGFEATREIRKIEQSSGKGGAIPIIAMTASLLKSDVDNCYEAGMDNYIPKPYKSEELIVPIYEEMKK